MSAPKPSCPSFASRYAITLASFGLLWLAFHPADLPGLAYVALVPWLMLLEQTPGRKMLLPTILGFWLYEALRLTWVAEIAWPPVLAIPALGLPGTLVFWVTARFAMRFGLPLVVWAPLALATSDLALEQLIQVSWTSAGYSQWRWLEALQTVPFFRVFLLSGFVYGVNAFLADCGLRLLRKDLRFAAVRTPLFVLLALAAGFQLYGHFALKERFEPGPRAVGIQPNIPQENRVARRFDDIWREHFLTYERFADPGFEPDLLVTPETTFLPIQTGVPGLELKARLGTPVLVHPGDWRRAGDLLLPGPGQLSVIGYVRRAPVSPDLPQFDEDGDGLQEWNVAAVLRAGNELLGESQKRVLVPLGESLPGRGWLPFREAIKKQVIAVGGRLRSMRPGEGPHPTYALETPRGRFRFGVNICFEMVFPREFLDLCRAPEPPDFLVNISNDGWYRLSSELDLVHVASRFRALECGRSLFRVSNTGISTLIDPRGRVLATVSDGGREKAVQGVLSGEIPIARGKTFWLRFGDAPTAALLAILWGLAFARRRRPV